MVILINSHQPGYHSFHIDWALSTPRPILQCTPNDLPLPWPTYSPQAGLPPPSAGGRGLPPGALVSAALALLATLDCVVSATCATIAARQLCRCVVSAPPSPQGSYAGASWVCHHRRKAAMQERHECVTIAVRQLCRCVICVPPSPQGNYAGESWVGHVRHMCVKWATSKSWVRHVRHRRVMCATGN